MRSIERRDSSRRVFIDMFFAQAAYESELVTSRGLFSPISTRATCTKYSCTTSVRLEI